MRAEDIKTMPAWAQLLTIEMLRGIEEVKLLRIALERLRGAILDEKE